jgi:hypothetical protein
MPNSTVPANATSLSAIFREAHTAARRRMAPQAYPGAGREWCASKRAFVVIDRTYRQAFAAALKSAWADAKAQAALGAVQAARPKLTAAEIARVVDLEERAFYQPINRIGFRQAAALRAEIGGIYSAAATRQGPDAMAVRP